MTINVYQKGDLVRIEGVFTDTEGTLIDPNGVSLFVTNPAGVTTEYIYGTDLELVKDSTGNYHVDVTADAPGQWLWKWASTGTGQAAEHGEFMVEPSAFVPEEA